VSPFALVAPTLRALRLRFALLGGLAAVLVGSAALARLLSSGSDHVELDRIFELGGTTLASAFLLLGWLVGRFPLIATLVLFAGFFSHDRDPEQFITPPFLATRKHLDHLIHPNPAATADSLPIIRLTAEGDDVE
jgi:hypothetical protein